MKSLRLLLVCLVLSSALSASAAAKEKAAKPAKIKFSTKRGFHEAPFDLSISSDAATAKLFFTTNGSMPTPTSGQLHVGPIRISTTAMIRAAGYQDDKLVTEVDTHTFLFIADVLKQTGANAPYFLRNARRKACFGDSSGRRFQPP